MAYQEGVVSLHAEVSVRVSKEINGRKVSKIIKTTVGRMIFNDPHPAGFGLCGSFQQRHHVRFGN